MSVLLSQRSTVSVQAEVWVEGTGQHRSALASGSGGRVSETLEGRGSLQGVVVSVLTRSLPFKARGAV